MSQIYSLDQLTKEEKKSKIEVEAEKVEQENYLTSKQANEKLNKIIGLQKSTRDVLEEQDEKIDKIMDISINIVKNTEKVNEVNKNILNEKNIWGRPTSIFDGFFNWLFPDNKHKKEIEKITKNKYISDNVENQPSIELEPSKTGAEEYVKGENKTEAELSLILDRLKIINNEARSQNKIIGNQNRKLNDIKKINEISGKYIDETETKIRK